MTVTTNTEEGLPPSDQPTLNDNESPSNRNRKVEIHIYTTGGFCQSFGIEGVATDDEIVSDLLGGKCEVIKLDRSCFVKANISAVVLKDVQETPTP